jgi:hypothetical protein
MTFTAGIALALATVLNGGNAASVAQAQDLAQPMPQAQSVQEYVKEYFADVPVMYAIAGCESHYHQYDVDGSILRNPKSSALGLFQIMQSAHEKTAAQLGIDIYTIQGNAAYAKYLYDQEGTVSWNSSKACWGKTQAAKDLAIASK